MQKLAIKILVFILACFTPMLSIANTCQELFVKSNLAHNHPISYNLLSKFSKKYLNQLQTNSAGQLLMPELEGAIQTSIKELQNTNIDPIRKDLLISAGEKIIKEHCPYVESLIYLLNISKEFDANSLLEKSFAKNLHYNFVASLYFIERGPLEPFIHSTIDKKGIILVPAYDDVSIRTLNRLPFLKIGLIGLSSKDKVADEVLERPSFFSIHDIHHLVAQITLGIYNLNGNQIHQGLKMLDSLDKMEERPLSDMIESIFFRAHHDIGSLPNKKYFKKLFKKDVVSINKIIFNFKGNFRPENRFPDLSYSNLSQPEIDSLVLQAIHWLSLNSFD